MRLLLVLSIVLPVVANAELDATWRSNMAFLWQQKARECLEKNEVAAAVTCYDSALAYTPRNGQTWFARAMLLEQLGAYDRAIASYESTHVSAPKELAAWHNGARILNHLGRHTEALVWSDSSLRLAPGDSQVWYCRGRIMAGLERWADVVACHTTALTYGQTTVEALFYRAIAFFQLHDYESAMGSFLLAQHIDPANASIWSKMATTQYMAGKYDEAVTLADSSLAHGPEPTTHYLRAAALSQLERYDEARTALTAAFEDPSPWPLRPAAERLRQYLAEHYQKP